MTRCTQHPTFEADYCPSCGTSRVLGTTDAETAENIAQAEAPAVGARVEFRPGFAPYAQNFGNVFVVTPSPTGEAHSVDVAHEGGPRLYVWLIHEDDVNLAPSRQRTRSAYVSALRILPTTDKA